MLQNSNIERNLDCIESWKHYCLLKKGDGTLLYPELEKFVTAFLLLPHSSACVERIFSSINLNKTKVRNRLSSTTLSGILHSKRGINSNNKFFYDFDVSNKVLEKHSSLMYKDKE